MEGKSTYDASYKELTRIKMTLNSGTLSINFDKLDANTSDELKKVILTTANKRQSAILNLTGNPDTSV